MAGVQAGRLSIDIVAEVARLQADLDKAKQLVKAASGDIARSAKAANDNLSSIGRGASAGIQQYASDVARLKAQLDPAWQAQQRYNQQVELGMRALKSGAIDRQQFITHMRQINAELKGVQSPMQRVTAQTGEQKQGMQQLSFQLSDVATQFASGTPPMQIFAQQAGQTVQAVTLMAGSTGKLAAFLSGPWGAAIVAATVVLVPFIGRLIETATEASAAEKALDSLIKKRREEAEAAAEEGRATTGLYELIERRDRLEAAIEARRQRAGGSPQQFQRDQERLMELNLQILSAQDALQAKSRETADKVTTDVSGMIAAQAKLASATTAVDRAQAEYSIRVMEANEAYEKSNKSLADQIKLKNQLTAAEKDLSAAQQAAEQAREAIQRQEEAARKAAAEFKRRVDESNNYIESLHREVEQIGKTEKEIRLMEVARRKDAAATEEQARQIQELSDKRELDLGVKKLAEEMKQAEEFQKNRIDSLDKELMLMGLVGEAREIAALALEKEGFMIEATKNHVLDAAAAWEEYYNKKLAIIQGNNTLERERERVERLTEQVNALTSALGNIGGVGGQIGKVLGALTSDNPTAALLGMGGIGTLVGLGTKGGQEAYQKQRQAIEDGLTAVFGQKAQGFASTMASVLQGAGTGSLVGGILGGGKTEQLGSSIGGALGQAIGSKVLSSLGSAAGPVGAIAGAVLGNVLGGLLSSTPRGSATFSGSGLVGTRGNSDSRIAGATKAGNSALDVFNQLLDQLGATASGINFSAGIRKNNFVLDPSGQGRTKGAGVLNFGRDEEAFMKAMLQEIISDATFEGLSEGFNNYLKNGAGDIADRIQDVLGLKGALDELKSLKDPQGFALEGLDKEFAKLREIAQATGEGLAEIEELYGLKRKELVDRYAQEALEKENALKEMRVTILQLEGKQVEALALAREIELSTMSGAEQALARRIHQLQDEAVAAAEAARVAEERKGLEIRLAEALGNEEEALRLRREQELAAVSELNRALLQQIHTTEDAAAAAARMAQTQAQAISSMQSAAATIAGGGAGGFASAANDPLLGVGVQMRMRGFSAEVAAAAIRKNVADQAVKAFPDDIARQQGFVADFEARLGGPKFFGGGSAQTAGNLGYAPGKNAAISQARVASQQQAREQRAAERAQREEEQRGRLADAYERESRALQDLIDKWSDVSKTLKDYRQELKGQIQSPLATFRSSQIALMKAAGSQNPEELSKLPGLGRDFLDIALRRSSTEEDFRKHLMFVDQRVAQAEGFAGDQVDSAERQLDALNRSVDGQMEIKEAVETVAEILRRIEAGQDGFRSEQKQLGSRIMVETTKNRKLTDDVTEGGNGMRIGAV